MKLQQMFERIEEGELLEIVGDLIRIPSHLKTEGKEQRLAAHVETLLEKMGFGVELQEVEDGRCNAIVKIEGEGGGRSLLLNGHLDTVPPGTGMKEPYTPRVSDGRLYGRGACDMKGAVGSMIYALYLLRQSGISFSGDLFLTAVIGEETGGAGTRHLVNSGFRTDFAVVGEPTDLRICTSHKGVCNLLVTFMGRACHGSVPEQGANAIIAASDFIQRMKKELLPRLKERMQERVGAATINVGVIGGGTKVNIVADSCALELDRRWVEGESMQSAVSEIEDIAGAVCEEDPSLRYEVQLLNSQNGYYGPLHVPERHELVGLVSKALGNIAQDPEIVGMQGWTDAATLYHAGIPAVLFGPGGLAQAHTSDEWVEVRQLVESVKGYIAIAAEICGGG